MSILASCGQDKYAADPAPVASGSFAGSVTVQDELGRPVAAASGVAVTLEGGPTPMSTTTDAAGRFQFQRLPWGRYTAVYKRPDVGTWQEQNLLLDEAHPNLAKTVTLGQVASTVVKSFSLTGPAAFPQSQPYTLGVAYNSSLYPDGFSYWLYLSTRAEVSSTNYLLALGGGSNQNPSQLWLSHELLLRKGFKSGDKVYVVAYGAPGQEVRFTDPANTDRPIITNLNPTASPVRSFVLP